ncbi:MAG: phosphatidate cytidylyltransferase [Bryobacteraceae bacterium]
MKRALTAAALIPLAIYLIFWSPAWLFLLAAAVMGLVCYSEYAGLVAEHGIRQPGAFGIAAGLLLLFWPHFILIELTAIVILALIAGLKSANLSDLLPYAGAILLGAFYTFAPWRLAVDLRHASIYLLFFAIALNWVGDTAAYYVGKAWGNHKLAPAISPHKTWEGAIASVFGSLVFGLLYLGYFLPRISWWEIVILAVVGNVAGQFGDLAESALKRGAGVKDSGHLLPGHGGMLDRIDSSLFAVPAVYFIHLLSVVLAR